MSASNTTAAGTAGGSAETPALSDAVIPWSYSALITTRQTRPSSSCRALSAWCPSTTSSGDRPPASARRAAPRSTLSPPSSNSILLHPMRLEVPAASRTPATGPAPAADASGAAAAAGKGCEWALPSVHGKPGSGCMDCLPPHREMAPLAPGVPGEQLGDDAARHLRGPVGAAVEAHPPGHPLPLSDPSS